MKTLFRSSLASPRWSWLTRALAACAVTAAALHTPHAAAAGGQTCYASPMQSEVPWQLRTDFSGLTNGVTVADVVFSQTISAGNVQVNYTGEVSAINPSASGLFNTVPLQTFPGLGLRWSYAGYENVSNAEVDPSTLPAVGTVVTRPGVSYLVKARFTTTPPTKVFKFKWRFELVVTDIRAYAGGIGDFTRETGLGGMQALPSVSDIYPTIVHQSCYPTLAGFDQALGAGGAIALPELPKPPTPTCQFPISTLNQTVMLNSSTTGRVPANGAARTEGAASETRFNINAVNCGANSNYAIYFIDTSAAGASKDYLNSTSGSALSGKVNLRLYQGSNSVPVQYGPAPTGSGLPANPPGVTNSGTQAGSNFVHDFYAQYVRAPGVTGTLPAGSMGAQTTITVVYP